MGTEIHLGKIELSFYVKNDSFFSGKFQKVGWRPKQGPNKGREEKAKKGGKG